MFLKAIVEDRFCKDRYIGYYEHSIQVFYKHELRSLAELFGCLDKAPRVFFALQQEFNFLKDILQVDRLNLPPPLFTDLPLVSHSPFRLACSVALSSFAFLSLFSGTAHALPTGYQSAAGNVQFQQNGNTLNVSTQSQQSIANYQTFNINQGETVNFNLPNAQSVILNRVTGTAAPSEILGSMNSNGQVFITNPSGIIFGSSAQVNVGALHASTLGISDQDFKNGKYTFTQGSNPSASVTNQGNIQTAVGGYVVLSGGHVENSGNIYAPQGQIDLAVGSQVSMTVANNLAVNVTVDDTLKQAVQGVQEAITNSGTLNAPGGIINAQAALEQNIYTKAVNNSGIMTAEGFNSINGEIALSGTSGSDTVIANSGVIDARGNGSTPNGGNITLTSDAVINDGIITASSDMGGKGGNVEIAAKQISLDSLSMIDVSGDLGGGTALIGGDTHGTGDFTHAIYNYVGPDSYIYADAGTQGNGGKVIVWSDNSTYFYGNISAQGGVNGGLGGFSEVSGKGYLDFLGNVNLLAADGSKGTLLLDPSDIVIQQFSYNTPGNLVALFDANNVSTSGGNVTTWWDQSGNGDNATQGTGSAQGAYVANAVNGHPSVLFNGASDFYNFSLAGISGTNYTMFALADMHFSIPLAFYTQNYFLGVHGSTGNGSFQYGWDDTTHFSFDNNGNPLTASSGVPAQNTWNTFSTSLSQSSGRNLYINGQQAASDGFTSPLNITASARIGKGNGLEGGGDTNWYAGYVSQIIVYKTALSTADRQMVEQTIAAEWGTPSGNPLSSYSYITQGYLQYLSQTTNINLTASNSITIDPMAGGVLALGGNASLTLNAGGQIRMMNTTDTIRTEGGSINITGGNLILGNLNTTGAGGGKSASVDLVATSGDVSVNNVTTGGGGFTVDANNNISLTGAITTSGGAVNVTADTGLANNGFVSIGGTINSGNADINLVGSEMIINNTVNAGSGNIYIDSSVSKLINVGGGIDNADSAGLFDISNPELGRLTAANVQIGNTATGGNFNVVGNLNVAGRYNLTMQDAGNYSASGQTITLGTQTLNVTVLGTAVTGAVNGGATTVNITSGGAMTESGPITVTGAGSVTLDTTNNGPISLTNNVGGGANTLISANGSGSISQTGGSVTGGVVTLSSGTGNIGAVGANINTSTGSMFINTGGLAYVNNNFGGDLHLGNSSGGNGFNLYNSGGAVSINGSLTGKYVNTTTNWSIYTNGPISSTNGDVNLLADQDSSGADVLEVNNSITSSNGNINLEGPQMIITPSGTLNAGANWVTLKPTQNVAVNIGGVTDNHDSPTLFDVSNPELGRITAGTLQIGDLTKTGNMTVVGNVNVSGAGPAEAYNLSFQTGGNYSATGETITLGSKTLNVTSLGTANTGTVTGNATNVNITSTSTLTQDGPVTVTGAGTVTLDTTNNGNIVLEANTGGGATTIVNANGSGSITQPSGTVLGTNMTLTSGTGNIGTSVKPILTGPGTLNVNTLGSAWVNDTGDTTLAASSAGNNGTLLVTANGNLTTSGIVSGGTNTDVNISATGNLTTNFLVSSNGGPVTITADSDNAAGGDLTLNANVTSNNGLITLHGSQITSPDIINAGTGNITMTSSGSGGAGHESNSFGGNISGSTISITDAGGSNPVQDTVTGTITGTTVSISSKDQISVSGNITASNGPLSLIADSDTSAGGSFLLSNTGSLTAGGNNNITITGDQVSLGGDVSTGAGTVNIHSTDTAASGVTVNAPVSVTGAGIVTISTTTNGNVVLGANIGANTGTTIVDANGSGTITRTGGTVLGNNITLTSGTGNIGTSGTPILTGPGTLNVNTLGSAWINDTGNTSLAASGVGANQTLLVNANGSLTTIGAVSSGGNSLISLSTSNNGNIVLGTNVATNTDNTIINANGSGSISHTGGTVYGSNITLTSGSGDIGSSANRVELGQTTLTANTLGSVYVHDDGNLTLNTSSAGDNGAFDATATGNIVNISTVSGGTNTHVNLQADGDVTVNAGVTTVDGLISLYADDLGHNTGKLGVFSTVNSNNGNITLTGSQVDVDQLVNAGTGNVSFNTSAYKPIYFGGVVNDADSTSITDISAQELGLVTANSVNVGNTTNTTGMTLANNFDISGEHFNNLTLNTIGDYNSVGKSLTLGDKTLTINALGNINTGQINGGQTTANLNAGNDINVEGPLSFDTNSSNVNLTTTNGNINLYQQISGSTLDLSAGSSITNPGAYFNPNIYATHGATMSSGDYIGTMSRPINVIVSGGLNVAPRGILGGVSADMNGWIPQLSDLHVLNKPPGLVIFNGYWLDPSSYGTGSSSSSYISFNYLSVDLRPYVQSSFIEVRLLESRDVTPDNNQLLAQPLDFKTVNIMNERPRVVYDKDTVYIEWQDENGHTILVDTEDNRVVRVIN